MPPRTRGTKAAKAAKENIGAVEKAKLKGVTKAPKTRKVLADKTNSASDDNASVELPKKVELKKRVVNKDVEIDIKDRPRRERRVPNRFIENQMLKNLSNSKELDNVSVQLESGKFVFDKNKNSKTPTKNASIILSPVKTPQNEFNNSLIVNRPKRVCRLPSRFDDHSISPNKFIPVGCHASTPILQSKVKPSNLKTNDKPTSQAAVKQPKVPNKDSPLKNRGMRCPQKVDPDKDLHKKHSNLQKKRPDKSPINEKIKSPQKVISQSSRIQKPIGELNADTNNNAAQRLRTKVHRKNIKPVKTAGNQLQNSFSFRVLEDKKSQKRDSSHLDVYEFTYDPNEEPPPQKKKRKRVVRKKPAPPKSVVFKNNYDQNINRALAALKNVVTKKPQPPKESVLIRPQITQNGQKTQIVPNEPQATVKSQNVQTVTPSTNVVQHLNHISVGIEDIAADIEPIDHHEINYSPVTSPNRGKSPILSSRDHSVERGNQDPLNLQECISFFDDPPVASSSMNISTRKPHETPWRVQFEQLPIKWHVNTYVKPNMTPAVESSFINFEDSKKKHVYTNMVPEANEELPEIVDNNQSNLKQTSIISFIREVCQRSASKKKRAASVTPTKANSIFEDISNVSVQTNKEGYRTPRKTPRRHEPEISTPNSKTTAENQLNNDKELNSDDKENSNEGRQATKTKSTKEKEKDGTFFGFDESEDQENVSPVKIDNPRVRALRPRARAVLQEINAQTGPTRAKVPLAAKNKIVASSDAVNKVFEEMKSATDAPVFPEKNVENIAATEVDEQFTADDDEDSQSVHLFEDIEVVHHLQPTRKSYLKAAKKVTFQANSSDSESQMQDIVLEAESDGDDLADLTFTMPNVKQKSRPKKKTKKKDNLSKKEKAEMDAWAAGFNSMCEDIDEVPLLVE